MNDTIIEVANLGKKYILRHKQKERYTALRDVITNGVVGMGSRLFHIGNNQRIPPTREEFWALKKVSFEVKHGEVIGIIGRNGAGKSTLLKILSRITEPTTGRIHIRGRVASLLEVGTGFHPELTGRENIYLNGAILGMSRAEIRRKFDEIVVFSEVEKFLDTPVKRYSSGMYVRLAFSVAAHLDPDILLIDEVLAVGDAAFQKKCLGKMDHDSKRGRTVFFVSHNMSAVQGLCKRAIWMDKGRIVRDGDASKMVTEYLNSTHTLLVDNGNEVDSLNQDLVVEKVVLKDTKGNIGNSFEYRSDVVVEIHYNASKFIPKPYFWVGVSSQYGSLFVANMLFDDLRPDHIEGKGVITCVFKSIRLMPQTYSINIGARDQNGMRFLMPTLKSAVLFSVVGNARTLNMPGELSDSLIAKASPVVVNYEWRYMDGRISAPKWAREKSGYGLEKM